ncbi:MAG: sulfurtransferase [Spirochaetia bacterium]|nr:sulfurtransferase [Spirochaetia bacterium]
MKRILFFGLVLLAVISATSLFGVDIEPKYQEYARSEILISPERAQYLMQNEDNIVVVDVRDEGDYEAGHLPGAVNTFRKDYGARGGEYNLMCMRVDSAKIHELLGTLGIDGNSRIIVYSAGSGFDSFRFAWLVTMYGHDREKVHIIDGFFPAWKAAGLPTTTDKPSVSPVRYQPPGTVDESRLALIEDVDRALKDPNVIILDTRTPAEWWGIAQYEGASRKGHIPGAIHINYAENFTDEGIKSAAELRALYEAAGVTPDKEIIAYCQSGIRSSLTTTILADVLGYPNVKNYDGSWVEWSYDRDRPVTAYFLYIVSAVFILGIVVIGAAYIVKRRKGKSSKLLKIDLLVLIIYAIFLMWYFNLFSLISGS